jgi:hypothetical protein
MIFFLRVRTLPDNGNSSDNFVESISYSTKTGYIHNLAVNGNYAYLVAPRSFIILDISDKTNPKAVKNFLSDRNQIDVFIEDNYAYVGLGDMRFPNGGIRIFNISDPLDVKEIKNDLILPETPIGIFVKNDIGYIGDFASGMVIVNFSNKEFPEILANYEIAPVLDEDKYNELLDKAKTDYSGFKSDVIDKYSFSGINSEQFESVIERMGLDNFVRHLTILVTYGTEPHAWWLTVRGDYAYIALDAAGMDIVDISDPSNPIKVGNIKKGEKGNEYFFNSIALSGNYAYAAVDAHGLLVIDISDPSNPREVADVPAWSNTKWLESPGHMVRSEIQNDILYLSATEDGLYIYNISDKVNPSLIQKVDKSVENGKGTDWALDVQDDYVYTAYFNTCANFNRCSSANPNARYKPKGGFEIFQIK